MSKEKSQFVSAPAIKEAPVSVECKVIEEKDLTHEKLVNELNDLLDNEIKREEMGRNAKKLAIDDAQKRIADIIVSLI